MKYKKWTLDKKLEILTISEEIGIVEACLKYGVSTGTFYSWKKKHESQEEAYLINHKKLYRIMKEQRMLKLENRINSSGSGRKFVKFRKVNTSRPMECLKMDIRWFGFLV